MERYVIRGGQEGYDRLLVLHRERWPDSLSLLTRAGIEPGMECMDLGCGGGEVTLELATMVAPNGRAIGIDMDPVKLELGRQAARDRGITNVNFTRLNANEWDEPGSYNPVYSRFLLQHLSRPLDLLERMWNAVRPGGLLIVEDADHDGWYCHPPNRGFEFFVRTFNKAIDQSGGDHTFGRKLYESFLRIGVPDPVVSLVQSARASGEAKQIPWLTLRATKDAIVSEGIATSDEVDRALDDLARFAENPSSLIGAPRFFQVWSRR
jgi:ubiquinone/menaquinone biosynthesis C-methylase UbiE